MDASYIDDGKYDFRCVYTKNGATYCTASLGGEQFVPEEQEQVPEMPAEGVELNAAPVYTKLDLRGEGKDPYAGWAFELIFADGEWVKEIHIDALEDSLSEAEEFAGLTIRGCSGGTVYDSGNTMLLHITDNDPTQPSTLGFTTGAVTVDKASGTASVMIERVGGSQKAVTVEYATADGTAVAGKDYSAASGKLIFYAGVTQLPVDVELIDDGVQSDEQKTFTVTLKNVLGDDQCTLATAAATVSLYNSGLGTGANLATQLYDPEAVDLSSDVKESETAAAPGAAVITGTQVAETEQDDGLTAELLSPDQLAAQSVS
jgi:hypothetical protein